MMLLQGAGRGRGEGGGGWKVVGLAGQRGAGGGQCSKPRLRPKVGPGGISSKDAATSDPVSAGSLH